VKSFGKVILLFILLFLCNVNIFAVGDATHDKLKLMIDVMGVINANYVSETKPEDLVVGAVKGAVSTLKDPNSRYMGEKAYKKHKSEMKGSYGGVGIIIRLENNDGITVILPMHDTPAYKAGILPGDRIVKIDEKSTIDMSSDEASDLMRGKPGKKVKLTVARDNVVDPIEFNLVRAKIKLETVKTTMLDDGIAYIKLTEFNAQSADDIKKALINYRNQEMKALILDLRNNLGGLVNSAVDIISMFIPDRKLTLTTKGRIAEAKKEYFTSGNGEFSDLQLIILVNTISASASEILSGTMRDFKRALIIGSNTFGKGSVQTILPLPDGVALRLTIAKYYLPSGRPIDRSDDKDAKNGITPDIEIKVDAEDEVKLFMQEKLIFEKNKDHKKDEDHKSVVDKEEYVEDTVLNKAIEIIKEGKIIEKIESSTALSGLKNKKKKKK
jgi:carboxyl-terminal processing protease